MMSAGTGALGSAPRRPLASVARTDYSLRCGAKPRSPCPIATGAFTETVCFGPTRGQRQKWRFFMFARVEKKSLNPVDKHVGGRVRMRRLVLAMSQEKLGDALGLTFQQVQKYEKGTNRIGASRLHQISHILQVPVAFFFEGAADVLAPQGSGSALSMAEIDDFISDSEGLRLIRAFLRIDNAAL